MKEIFERIEYLKNKIIDLKDSDIRIMMISDYMMLLGLLKKMNKISDEDYKNYCHQFDKTSYINYLQKRISHYQKELVLNNQKLLMIILELKDIYLDIDLDNEPIVPNHDTSLLIEEFFGWLGKDVLDLYNRMKFNRIISIPSLDYGGWCYEQKTDEASYIFIKYSDKIMETSTLIHEMGHAYNCYLFRNYLTYTSCSIVGEMMSLLFEKMYLRFLENSNFNTDYLWYEYYLCLYDSVFDSYLISNLIKNNKIKFHEYNINCESLYSDQELSEFSDKLGCYVDEDCILTLRSFSYIISDIISDYFLTLMETDYENGFKEACNFIKEADSYSVKEILDKCVGDLIYTKARIKSVIEIGKSYQKRK